MKTRRFLRLKLNRFVVYLAIAMAGVVCEAQPVQTVQGATGGPDDYAITQRGPHSRVWRNSTGQTVTEIATGMHYWDGQQWTPSDPSFQVSADGTSFVAAQILDPTALAANLNTAGAVTVTTPDGVTLNSTPIAIGLYDAASGNSVVLATLTNTTGVLVDPQHVVYNNAFAGSGISASVIYSLPDTGSFHQDVVFTGFDPGFDPTVWGFAASASNTLRIQIYTEFYNAPQPETLMKPIYVETNQVKRASMASPDLIDYALDFGHYVFGSGRAYAAVTNGNQSAGVVVAKSFVTVSGRSFLVESIPLHRIINQFRALPPVKVSSLNGSRMAKKVKVAAASVPSLQQVKKASNEKIPMARNSALTAAIPKGLDVDYTVVLTSLDEPTLYESDATYLISGAVYDYNATIENAVFKYTKSTSNPSITVEGTLTSMTGTYEPAVFTAADDNTIGTTLSTNIWSAYTGNPGTNCYANPALSLSSFNSLSNLRFRYANQAVYLYWSFNNQASLPVSHSQFINCLTGILVENQSSSCSYGCGCGAFNLNNCLMSDVSNPVHMYGPNHTTYIVNATDCTFDSCPSVFSSDYSSSVSSGTVTFYNSIFSSSSMQVNGFSLGGVCNGFYNGSTFGSSSTSVSSIPYQTFGAGCYYLSPNSPFLTAGNTNSAYISSSLLSQLMARTTQPPVLLTNCFTNNTVLTTVASRDTSGKALGYHYDPLDYFAACSVSNASLLLTNGVALAYYDNLGILLQDGSQLISQGTPTQRNYLVYYALVQEQPVTVTGITNPVSQALPIDPAPVGTNNNPSIYLRLTTICAPTGETNLLNTADFGVTGQVISGLTLRDCEIYGAGANLLMNESNNVPAIAFTNNVFHRTPFAISNNAIVSTVNNLFYGSSIALTNTTLSGTTNVVTNTTTVSIRNSTGASSNTNINNAFNGVRVLLDGTVGHNGYLNGATNANGTTNSSDVIVPSYAWATGALGNYYQGTSQLYHTGSTSATNVGLYHYTVKAAQTIEGTNIVSIGYHYVAVNTSTGLPLSTSGDGIGDYLKDSNGDGIYDAGDLGNWKTNTTCAGGLNDAIRYAQGQNLNICTTSNDTSGLLGLQVYTPLK